ncbi:MAG TPA: hypothetical protein VGF73_01080 [Chthoniobacterales bacterium]
MPAGTKAKSATTTPAVSVGLAAIKLNTAANVSKVTESMSQSAVSGYPKKLAKFEAVRAAWVRGKADGCIAAPTKKKGCG